ncbi:hypothetical protein H8A97_30435 [Bradyrhizobium sp. Arg62]|uniref:hypothetical protein n=1 Tax=Bradyrhizobium brasilense TaxID=1419277 RepID=UPI001E2FEC86|nr:hypothetical protein [Bradyrhizobium brasilense]MCC8949304.1 hypothetical protein [Bradyrhizobium brasilense]
MSRREPRVLEEEEAYLGPVAVAQFIDCRWIKQWPMTWTRAGLAGLQNGYGRWTGTHQALVYGNGITEIAGGAAHWPGRRTQLSGT